MKIKWWEKTIEYKFVQEFIDINSFIAPLDGKEEKAGDAIFGKDDKYILIEFKKDETSIKDEKGKFDDNKFEEAKKSLENIDNHHILIYGREDNHNLLLEAKTYFSSKILSLSKDKFINGENFEDFKKYLIKFIAFKKSKKRDKTETGSSGYGLVAGVTSDGHITKCLTLEDFSMANNINLNIVLKQDKNKGNTHSNSNSPSP